MDIIPVITPFLEEIFAAAEDFQQDLSTFSTAESRVEEAGRRLVTGALAGILEDADEFLRNAPHRKEHYKIEQRLGRSLISAAGDILFERTQFRSRKDGTYHFLLDERMKLPKDEHFTEMGEVKLLKEAEKTSYQQAADRVSAGSQTVSKVAVMNKVHGIIEELPLESPEKKRTCKYLYIEADEDHIHRQKDRTGGRKDCLIGKLVYLFEGKEQTCKGRTSLINPVFMGGLYPGTEQNDQLWERIQEYIEKNYDQRTLKQVYISGDGGSWIKAGTEHIAKSAFVADRFHLMKYINAASLQMLDDSVWIKGKFYKYIYKDKPKKVRKLIQKMLRSAGNPAPVEACGTFLENNWEAVQTAFHDKHVVGCSAEGHVSHIYSDRMSSRPMGWSAVGADRMCRLRCLVQTYGDGKILDLVKIRRERQFALREATGTDDVVPEKQMVRRHYTKAQLETAAYAERLQANLSALHTRKQISISLHTNLF